MLQTSTVLAEEEHPPLETDTTLDAGHGHTHSDTQLICGSTRLDLSRREVRLMTSDEDTRGQSLTASTSE